jgi:hypothetical protein
MEKLTDNQMTQQDMIDKSYKMLTQKELFGILSDTTITGIYLYNNTWYKYMVNSFNDGNIEGKNNIGSFNEGRWQINSDASMSIEWDGYWEDWRGFAYKVDGRIMFFDATTKKWRTTYTLVENKILPTEM